MSEYSPVPQQVLEQGIADSSGHLSNAAYELVTDLVPITTVDMIPVDISEGSTRLGAIVRATGQEAGKLALIGGRILKNETIDSAIGRHLLTTIGNSDFNLISGNEIDRPFLVVQYKHATSSNNEFDPTKHSVAMTYLISIPEPELSLVGNEASSFEWINTDRLPANGAFNQHLILRKAAQFLADRG